MKKPPIPDITTDEQKQAIMAAIYKNKSKLDGQERVIPDNARFEIVDGEVTISKLSNFAIGKTKSKESLEV